MMTISSRFIPARRDILIFGSGFLCGMFLAPIASVHAQAVGVASATGIAGLPQPDSGTAGVLTKFFTDLGKRVWGGDERAPEWAPLTMAAILGPVITALITMASGVSLTDPATIAKVVLGGFIAGTAVAVLLTQGHNASHAPEVNLPPRIAAIPPLVRASLCCTNADCTNSQAQTQTIQAAVNGVPSDAIPTPSNAAPIPPIAPLLQAGVAGGTPGGPPTTAPATPNVPPPMRR